MHTVWERTLRRAALPLAYTKGFNPRPRFQIAASLPMGATSQCEILDIWMENPPAADEIAARLARCAPPGLLVIAAQVVPLQSPAMQTRLLSAEYEVLLPVDSPDQPELERRIAELQSAASLPRTWRGKAYDLRPLVEEIVLVEASPARLRLRLSAREGATGRPEEVLAELQLDPLCGQVQRKRLIFRED
jgi:radical SAM-linked protein